MPRGMLRLGRRHGHGKAHVGTIRRKKFEPAAVAEAISRQRLKPSPAPPDSRSRDSAIRKKRSEKRHPFRLFGSPQFASFSQRMPTSFDFARQSMSRRRPSEYAHGVKNSFTLRALPVDAIRSYTGEMIAEEQPIEVWPRYRISRTKLANFSVHLRTRSFLFVGHARPTCPQTQRYTLYMTYNV